MRSYYLFLFVFIIGSCAIKKDKKPNVLFLIVDDMNNYGFYDEYPNVKMPYLDRFKETAVTFRHAYCASPICTPSRAATFSGLFPHETGVYFNGGDPWQKSKVLQQIETLPECFKRNGYKCFGNGKLYHAKLEEGRDTLNWNNSPYAGGFKPYPDEEHQLNGRFWGHQAFPDEDFPDCINADKTIDFLQKDHDKPFFCALGLWRPHSPFTCPQRFYNIYNLEAIEIPKGYLPNDLSDIDTLAQQLIDPFNRFGAVSGDENIEKWKEMIWAYLACNSFADWNIGRVIEALNKSRYADNTIVVFWSDNGYHCGEKNHWEKGTIWEQASLTPLAIRLPGNINGGKVCREAVSLVDIYPTLVDLCKIAPPKQKLNGQNLHYLLKKTDEKRAEPALTTLGIEYSSLRNETHRYIRYSNGSEELYNHLCDPNEFYNIAKEQDSKEIIDYFRSYIPKHWKDELDGRRF